MIMKWGQLMIYWLITKLLWVGEREIEQERERGKRERKRSLQQNKRAL